MLDLDKVKKVCAENNSAAEQAGALGISVASWRQYRSGLVLAGVIPALSGRGRSAAAFDGDTLTQTVGKRKPVVPSAVVEHSGAKEGGTLVWTKAGKGKVTLSFKK